MSDRSVTAIWGVSGLEVRFGHRAALQGVTLEVPPGAVTAVAGGDGAGKTTLLRVLVGGARASAGGVGRPPREKVGYLAAVSGVYSDLTVEENLEFAASAYRMDHAEFASEAEELLRRTGLTEARTRLGGQLSGGMRQKLGLAMAMVHRPRLLVLDEPTTGVDPVSRSELWRLVARAAADGVAVVFATTYLDEAERAAWVLVLDEGRPLAAGTPEEVVAAVPGALFEADRRPASGEGWRRGARWRVWVPGGAAPPGTTPVRPDLQDAVVVSALAAAARRRVSVR